MGLFGSNISLGIDIGTTSIKIVELKYFQGKTELSNYGILEKYGHLERINDAIQTSSFKILEESTALMIKDLLKTSKIESRPTFISLPAFNGFVVVADFPYMSPKELAKAVKLQAPQYIPMSINEITLDYQVIESSNEYLKVLIMAVPTEIITRYVKVAQLAKLDLKGLELESVAVARLFGLKEKEPIALVDIGGRSTSISIIDNGSLRQIRSIDVAGGDLTQVIATGLGINPFRAEEIKKSYGLNIEYQGELAILRLLTPLLDVITRETNKVINNYYLLTKRKVEKVFLTGGGANLLGITDYYSKTLSIPVFKVDPFNMGLISYHPKLAPIIAEIGSNLTTACAVAYNKIS
ncbi:MAG: type IV pilus assembly protein PilM [Minisyncoccia bacterium]